MAVPDYGLGNASNCLGLTMSTGHMKDGCIIFRTYVDQSIASSSCIVGRSTMLSVLCVQTYQFYIRTCQCCIFYIPGSFYRRVTYGKQIARQYQWTAPIVLSYLSSPLSTSGTALPWNFSCFMCNNPKKMLRVRFLKFCAWFVIIVFLT